MMFFLLFIERIKLNLIRGKAEIVEPRKHTEVVMTAVN